MKLINNNYLFNIKNINNRIEWKPVHWPVLPIQKNYYYYVLLLVIHHTSYPLPIIE